MSVTKPHYDAKTIAWVSLIDQEIARLRNYDPCNMSIQCATAIGIYKDEREKLIGVRDSASEVERHKNWLKENGI